MLLTQLVPRYQIDTMVENQKLDFLITILIL